MVDKVTGSVQKYYRWLPLIAGTVAFLLYANTIGNNYALDDGVVIADNPYVQQGLKGIPGILSTDVWQFEGNDLGYYRPLPLVSFAIEHQFSGNNPHVSHFINAFLFALTVALLYLVLIKIFSAYTPVFPFLIAVLFAAHPIHTEVVANIKSRDELLAFLNLLAALYFLLRAPTAGWKQLLPAAFFYYLALLSKETAIAGVLFIPVLLYFASASKPLQILKWTVPFIAVLGFFLLQKYMVLGSGSAKDATDIVSFPYAGGGQLPTAFTHLFWYVKLILLPYPLSYNYAYNQIPVAGWSSPQTIAGIILAAVLVFLSFYSIKNKGPLQLGVVFFGLMLLPALAFVILKGGILAERFLYEPSLGFCIVLTWLIFKGLKIEAGQNTSSFSAAKLSPFVLITGLYSFVTIPRNAEWKDDLTISRHDVQVSPNSCQVHLHYGKKLIDLGAETNITAEKREYFNTGIRELHRAVAINPHYARAYYKMAYAYQVLEPDKDSAIYYYNRAIDVAPGYALAYNNLGSLYAQLGRPKLATYYLQAALKINPNLEEAARNLERVQRTFGAPAAPVDTTSFEYYSSTGIKYAREKNFTPALAYLKKAAAMKPTSVDALVNLAACYGMMQDFKQSEATLLKAQQLEPNNKSVIQNLFTLYHLSGNKAKEEEYRKKLNVLNSVK